MGYLGLTPTTAQQNYLNIDDISGSFNGTTTSFALQVGGVAPVPFPVTNSCLISVGGVVQQPDETGTDGFRISGGNIIFSSAPGTGEDFFGLVLAGADYLNVGANFPDGTVGNPSITFESDLNTGIYHPSTDSIAITSGGTAALTIDSNRRVGIGTTSPGETLHISGGEIRITSSNAGISNATTRVHCYESGGSTAGYFGFSSGGGIFYHETGNTQPIRFFQGGSEAARIDGSSRLLVGTSTAADSNILQLEGSASGDTEWAGISLRRGIASGSLVANQYLGSIGFQSQGGGQGGVIRGIVDSNWTSSSHPTRLVFETAPSGSSSTSERLRISSTGAFGLSGANYGTSGQVLTSQGSGSAPQWGDVAPDGAFRSVQYFTTSGTHTWTRPAGLQRVRVYVTGGGGGGALENTNTASGGGAGGTAIELIEVASLGATETVTVGASGADRSGSYGPGSSGGTSSFGSHCSATGGGGGTSSYTGQGGIGSNGDFNIRGGAGHYSWGSARSGNGGNSFWAGGGQGAGPNQGGSNGTFGSGGGGSTGSGGGAALISGAGGAGIVVVEQYF